MSLTDKTKPWSQTDLPNFLKRKILILPGSGYFQAVKMFAEAGFKKAETVDDADVVCFLGGADVSPKLYGETPVEEVTRCDPTRDEAERKIYMECFNKNKPMFGICRGAQFLHVMCGGKLWQDVDNHEGKAHTIYDLDEDVTVLSSSTHHQMMRFNRDMMLIATTDERLASYFKNDQEKIENIEEEIEVEACVYYNEKALCIQGHPESGPDEFTSWSLHKLHDFLLEWEGVSNVPFLQEDVIKNLI